MNIKVVFLGPSISDINSTYLERGVNAPSLKYQTILAGPLSTGVIYRFSYQFSFPDSSMVQNFATYLKSIGVNETKAAGDRFNPYFDNATTRVGNVVNTFYNASSVESWISSHLSEFGGTPVPGYTLLVADLHSYGIPSMTYQEYANYSASCGASCVKRTAMVHYYNRTATDPDLGLVLTRPYMTAWGGSSRFYFIDLSAGPSYRTQQLPVQVAAGLRGVDLSTPYGRTWYTQFISDYLVGAVNNLFAPDQLYPVNYSQKYNFHLFVFDNRTGSEKAAGPRLDTTVKSDLIRTQLASLLPYANVTVVVSFANITAYTQLASVIANATTKVKDPALDRPTVDARLVYNWLTENGLGHVREFVNGTRNNQEFDIPAFVFAFQGNYTFAFTFKEDILSKNSRSFAGVALGDMVLLGQSQSDFKIGQEPRFNQTGKGVGFTLPAIHEFGHMLGLNHPFIYDQTEDFTDSVMAYYPYSLTFSQFDEDTLLRGINDQLLIFAQVTLANTTSNIFNSARISVANRAIALANEKYGAMQYAQAVQDSIDAALNAYAAQLASVGLFAIFSPGLVFGLIGLAVGVAVGVLVGYLVFKRKPTSGIQYYRCPTCQQPLRWDAVMTRWYCDRCQKPI